MSNPYSVLNIGEGAGDDEIKEAYRRLAREYHEQLNQGSPAADIAKQKMAELDAAYDEIMSSRSGNYYQSQPTGREYAYNQNNGYSQYGDVRSQINSGRIDDAEMILDGIPKDMRNAEWYYLKGQIQHRRGWFDEAYNNYSKACQLDPTNTEYSNAFNSLNKNYNGGYRQSGSSSSSCGACDVCTGLMCADCCCECMGGDLLPCC